MAILRRSALAVAPGVLVGAGTYITTQQNNPAATAALGVGATVGGVLLLREASPSRMAGATPKTVFLFSGLGLLTAGATSLLVAGAQAAGA